MDAGEKRKFVAKVYASQPGELSSRATARAKQSDLQSRSKQTTTQVIAPDLKATLSGTNRVYGNNPAEFTALITNTGNAPAEDVKIELKWPEQANLVDVADLKVQQSDTSSNSESSQSNSQSSDQEPALASSKGDSKSADEPQMKLASETRSIDRLEPGQTAEINFAVQPNQLKKIPARVVATYVCAIDQAQDQAKAKSQARTTAMAMTTAKVVRLPAMQLVVIDDEDPVVNGSDVRYSIRVWNEGDAPDSNVELIAQLPDGLKFKSAEGPTEFKQDGNSVKFKPVDTMEPGESREFVVTAESKGRGSVRLKAKLNSEKLNSNVVAEEPTRLFDRNNQKN